MSVSVCVCMMPCGGQVSYSGCVSASLPVFPVTLTRIKWLLKWMNAWMNDSTATVIPKQCLMQPYYKVKKAEDRQCVLVSKMTYKTSHFHFPCGGTRIYNLWPKHQTEGKTHISSNEIEAMKPMILWCYSCSPDLVSKVTTNTATIWSFSSQPGTARFLMEGPGKAQSPSSSVPEA